MTEASLPASAWFSTPSATAPITLAVSSSTTPESFTNFLTICVKDYEEGGEGGREGERRDACVKDWGWGVHAQEEGALVQRTSARVHNYSIIVSDIKSSSIHCKYCRVILALV